MSVLLSGVVCIVVLAALAGANQDELDELHGNLQFVAAFDDTASWKSRIKELKAEKHEFPVRRWSGRGIAMSAGRRTYFTSAYVTIRILRDHVKCTLPIEVFYAGSDELPSSAIEHMSATYNVHFVDLSKIPDLKGVDVKGYQIKAFSVYYSSFSEVLWMDSDNIALEDPAALFDSAAFATSAAIFWPDYCNMVSVRRETFQVFGKKVPPNQPQPREGKATIWPDVCTEGVKTEIETGQLLIHKERSYAALRMLLFININHKYFLKRLFHGDKMTFHYAFQAVNTPYFLVSYQPLSYGIAGAVAGSSNYFCGNTMGQRHPDNGRVIFLHRTSAKYKDVSGYFSEDGEPARAWTHYAKQPARSSWYLAFRGELPDNFFVTKEASIHNECVHPSDPAAVIKPVRAEITATETACLGFLQDLRKLRFYPGYRQCDEHSMFFCQHA